VNKNFFSRSRLKKLTYDIGFFAYVLCMYIRAKNVSGIYIGKAAVISIQLGKSLTSCIWKPLAYLYIWKVMSSFCILVLYK
jgi:hypothetical protein